MISFRALPSKAWELMEESRAMTLPGLLQISAGHGEELIPGLPDVITLNEITTRLPWSDIHMLICVSRSWFSAIRSRQVYDARVSSNSTELLYLPNHNPPRHIPRFSLHPVKDEWATRYGLPRVARVCSNDVILDGKLYVFGELDCNVNVIDLAAHGQWKQCASLHEPREEFECGVIDGKIYVLGDNVCHESDSEYDLYNPKGDTWSPVRSIVSLKRGQLFGARSRFLVGGNKFMNTDPGIYVWLGGKKMPVCVNKRYNVRDAELKPRNRFENADLLEFYDPAVDNWRLVERVGKPKENMFVAMEHFYSLNPLGLYVYDFQARSWVHLHTFSLAAIGPVDDSVEFWPVGILTVDRELLAVVHWPSTDKSILVQSKGLHAQKEGLVWQRADYSTPYRYTLRHSSIGYVKTIGL